MKTLIKVMLFIVLMVFLMVSPGSSAVFFNGIATGFKTLFIPVEIFVTFLSTCFSTMTTKPYIMNIFFSIIAFMGLMLVFKLVFGIGFKRTDEYSDEDTDSEELSELEHADYDNPNKSYRQITSHRVSRTGKKKGRDIIQVTKTDMDGIIKSVTSKTGNERGLRKVKTGRKTIKMTSPSKGIFKRRRMK